MKSSEIRNRFLAFFEARGHRAVRSSSLVPANDPTLLFSNAGMNQFKDVFLGREKRDYSRACSAQKCVRAGGKHNDLEQVGRTRRHHTFFEMLGNFSFGDYFKKEAIPWAWELFTKEFAIPRDKLYVTTFLGSGPGPDSHDIVPRDAEAYDVWATIVPKDRIVELGLKDNFWQMGDTGPCGPCSEIHYDMGPEASELGHKDCSFPCPDDCGRYVELWNLVFMEYSRYCKYEHEGFPANWDAAAKAGHKHSDDNYACLALDLLPRPSIDTGAGLERMAAVLQGKISNFDTDLFRPLIDEAADLAYVLYGIKPGVDESLRIIADHVRSATFLISDGVLPSNEGRGYVLRRIVRRALYHGQTLGLNEPFLFKMSGHVAEMMKDAYPELALNERHIAKAIRIEEERYAQSTRLGVERLDEASVVFSGGVFAPFGQVRRATRGRLEEVKRICGSTPADEYPSPLTDSFHGGRSPLQSALASTWWTHSAVWIVMDAQLVSTLKESAGSPRSEGLPPPGGAWVPGAELFRLHDTFGLRPDFVRDIVGNYGLDVDMEGYEAEMRKQRERARASWKGAEKRVASPAYQKLAETTRTVFDGYTQIRSEDCKVLALVRKGEAISEAKPGEEIEIVLNHTPFYAEAGGQVGDTGRFYAAGSDHEIAHITDTYRPVTGIIAHKAVARDTIRAGDTVTAVVDAERRDAIRRNHTATHLLHAALHEIVGTHAKQAGSLVAPDRLRFDFTHYAGLGEQDVLDIEDLVNQHILRNDEVNTEVTELEKAIEAGAMALFGEKYGDKVRVVSIADGKFSKELCGGTHVARTGDIGLFKIVGESSVAAGTRRIEAITGTGVLEHLRRETQTLGGLAQVLRSKPEELLEAAGKLTESNRELQKLVKSWSRKYYEAKVESISPADHIKFVGIERIKVYAAKTDHPDRELLRGMIDILRKQTGLGSGVVVLGAPSEGKVILVASVSQDLTDRLDAAKIVRAASLLVDGKGGGGRRDFAQGGGSSPDKLDACIVAVPGIVESML